MLVRQLLFAVLLGAMAFAAPLAAEEPADTPTLQTLDLPLAQELGPGLRKSTAQSLPADDQLAACCKICRKGKACGNSCISRTKTCTKGKGCACDAAQ